MVEDMEATAPTVGKAHSLWDLDGNFSNGTVEVSFPVFGTVATSLAVGTDGTGNDGKKSFNFAVALLDRRADCGSGTCALDLAT